MASKMLRMTDYIQIVEVVGTKEANGWLEKGWKLAKIFDNPDGITYVLGLTKEGENGINTR